MALEVPQQSVLLPQHHVVEFASPLQGVTCVTVLELPPSLGFCPHHQQANPSLCKSSSRGFSEGIPSQPYRYSDTHHSPNPHSYTDPWNNPHSQPSSHYHPLSAKHSDTTHYRNSHRRDLSSLCRSTYSLYRCRRRLVGTMYLGLTVAVWVVAYR